MVSNLFSVEGRVIIVTGAGRGNGAAIAAGLARANARVYGLDIQYPGTDYSYETEVCDVTDDSSLERIVDRVFREHGRIDGLVNNAGISLQPMNCYDRSNFLETLSINALAPLRLGWMVAHVMKIPEGSGGSIVNVTNLAAHLGFPDNPAYQASKAALSQITRAMAVAFCKIGVRASSNWPGFIVTVMTTTSFKHTTHNTSPTCRT